VAIGPDNFRQPCRSAVKRFGNLQHSMGLILVGHPVRFPWNGPADDDNGLCTREKIQDMLTVRLRDPIDTDRCVDINAFPVHELHKIL